MNEIRNSSLLNRLIERAKAVGDHANAPITAEKIIVAIMDQAMNPNCEEIGADFKNVKALLEKHIPDWTKARQSLMEYICREGGSSFLDDLYLKKKQQEAANEAAQASIEEIPAFMLISRMMEDPSDALKSVMKKDEQTAAQEQEAESFREKFAKLFGQMEQTTGEKAQEETAREKEEVSAPVDRDVKTEMSQLVEDVKRIRTELQDCVYGQDNAIHVFTTGYFQANMLSMLDKTKKRPKATFLFAGPPGVGKTFLAEKVAESLKLPFMRFDMSEYSDKEANLEFCGADKVYKNSKGGNVTSFVDAHPKCVLLFDEIEKAHLSVIHLFLQILDAGRLRDNYTDREVSFTDAIIIFTTNAGRQLYAESENGNFSAISRKVIIRTLENDVNPTTGMPYFPGAICSRFASGNVVMFNRIEAHDLRAIARKEICRQAENLQSQTDIQVQIDEHVYTALLFSEGSTADARTIRGRSETFFNDELYELLRFVASKKAETGISGIQSVRLCVDTSGAPEGIKELFVPAQKARILMLADQETVEQCARNVPNVQLIGVQDMQSAVEEIKNQDIRFVLLDMHYGIRQAGQSMLNLEDMESPARDLFKFLKEQKRDMPVYVLETDQCQLNEEERISFARQGARGVLGVQDQAQFAQQLISIVEVLHQQASMTKLAKENKRISFETAQSVSADGKEAVIRLFDFEMGMNVDAEDTKKNILGAVSKPNVRFEDVIGAEDAKEELTYFVQYLRNPKKYMGTGVKAPKGVLLYGPPGTGKTMLAKAMACEAGVTFIAAEGNQFLKSYVGEGPATVHEMFQTARKYAPTVLFIDEIDAIAMERTGGHNSSTGVEATLTAFLAEMDGFASDPTRPVFVLAATNFNVEPGTAKSLDPAMMRRFDRRIYVDLPNRDARIRFMKEKIRKNPALDISDAQLETIAMRSTGMSLAELDSVFELALRSAIRKGSTKVTDAILEEAFETFNSGDVKKWDASQLERVARHEAGHTLLCWLGGETPSYVTIVARGNHGGYMQRAEQEGKAIYTRSELMNRIRTSLGGRAAELVYYGEEDGISTGASGDLETATRVAQRIVCTYGMDEDFGLAVVNPGTHGNDAVSMEVRTVVNRILEQQMAEAIRLISENKDKIDSLVAQLLVKNQLHGPQILEALGVPAENAKTTDAQ